MGWWSRINSSARIAKALGVSTGIFSEEGEGGGIFAKLKFCFGAIRLFLLAGISVGSHLLAAFQAGSLLSQLRGAGVHHGVCVHAREPTPHNLEYVSYCPLPLEPGRP